MELLTRNINHNDDNVNIECTKILMILLKSKK